MFFTVFSKVYFFRDFFWPRILQFLLHPLGLDRGLVQRPLFPLFCTPLETTFWPAKTANFPIFSCAEPPGVPYGEPPSDPITPKSAEKCQNWCFSAFSLKWVENVRKSGPFFAHFGWIPGWLCTRPKVMVSRSWKIMEFQENHRKTVILLIFLSKTPTPGRGLCAKVQNVF